MDEPEPLCARFGGEGCALPEGAVAVLFGLRGLLRQSISGIAEQKVSTRCGLFQRRTRGGVAREDKAQPLPGRAEDGFRLDDTSTVQRDTLAVLERLPLLYWYAQRPRLFG